MAIEYNKTNWVNNETKLNADNMNHIEDGIKDASDELNTKASVDYVNKTHYGYSGNDLLIINQNGNVEGYTPTDERTVYPVMHIDLTNITWQTV